MEERLATFLGALRLLERYASEFTRLRGMAIAKVQQLREAPSAEKAKAAERAVARGPTYVYTQAICQVM